MRTKLFLFKDDRWIEMGLADIPVIKLSTEKWKSELPDGTTLSFTCTLTKRSRSRLFGKRRKYTYRTIRKK